MNTVVISRYPEIYIMKHIQWNINHLNLSNFDCGDSIIPSAFRLKSRLKTLASPAKASTRRVSSNSPSWPRRQWPGVLGWNFHPLHPMYLESVKFEVDEMGFMRAYNRNEMNESQLIQSIRSYGSLVSSIRIYQEGFLVVAWILWSPWSHIRTLRISPFYSFCGCSS